MRRGGFPLGCRFAILVPASLLLLGIQFLPYSPRWLLEVDRDDEAKAVVYKLHGKGNEIAAELEYQEMHDTIKAEARVKTRSLRTLVSTVPMAKRLFVAVGVQVFTQFTGINVINYFGPTMYRSLGITGHKSLLVQGIYGAVGPIANLFFIVFLLDRVGRKKPLVFGAGSFVCTFSILAAIVATNPVDSPLSNQTAQRAGIAMIFLTSVMFSLSFGPVSWVLASEVFPTHARALGTMVATCCNWAFNTMIGQVAPIGMDKVGWKFYMLFVALNLVDMIIIAIFFPETKGKTLEEMNEYLFDSPGIPKPNVNSHGGYALTKAVHAKFIPLIRFLLDYGAEPQCKNCLAIFVAIRQKDLALVKLLIERDDSSYTDCLGTGKRKRRKLEDRVVVNSAMLKAAVKCDARDIVDYMAREKGCIPDMQTLHMMAK
ncbi:High-affinity glucose transporter [Termitomyces sp. T112]|nr:High-affinity glucose transporter [Termitomyces sp. T112]